MMSLATLEVNLSLDLCPPAPFATATAQLTRVTCVTCAPDGSVALQWKQSSVSLKKDGS